MRTVTFNPTRACLIAFALLGVTGVAAYFAVQCAAALNRSLCSALHDVVGCNPESVPSWLLETLGALVAVGVCVGLTAIFSRGILRAVGVALLSAQRGSERILHFVDDWGRDPALAVGIVACLTLAWEIHF